MKKLSDLDDELVDLDEEYEDDYDTAYDEDEEDYDDESGRLARKILVKAAVVVAGIVAVVIIALVVKLIFFTGSDETEMQAVMESTDTTIQEQEDTDDIQPVMEQEDTDIPSVNETVTQNTDEKNEQEPQNTEQQDPQDANMSTDEGTEVDVAELLSSGNVAETNQVTIGIDVAKYQGTIDWSQVASSGIDFAMVRVGYRADVSREICADTNAKYNMQEASKNGIKVGAYFFSTATTIEEAKEEADWVADYISQYQITYPVAYDCEGFDKPDSAQYNLTNSQRTDIAIAFLQEIYNRGYTPMFYASMGELSGNTKWDTTRIEGTYRIWVSQYPAVPYPQTAQSSYGGTHAMWQYTNRGTVAGIGRPVDVNVAYFGYEGTAQAQNEQAPEEAHADVEALMKFTDVNENVTAKDSTNLRNIPSQGAESTIVYTLKNGESVARTGVSDSGWSRLNYNGQIVYAVSSYLTTDLSYQAPAEEGTGSGDGLKTRFTDRNDQVTAKIEVNLRTLPSVTNPDATVAAVLHNGEYLTRTGINEEYGWSRVDYNGQTLYCISSYLTN
ncbi:MAG: glycoside hydrolase family 25 [Lachnospiraceae bacterium]|nr:glycoside hydrolase family 25 [Lachnospiraceae bacterium]